MPLNSRLDAESKAALRYPSGSSDLTVTGTLGYAKTSKSVTSQDAITATDLFCASTNILLRL